MLMLIFYYGYVLLDNYRIHKSHDWLSKSSLTEQDFNAIEQFGRWVTTFETLFVVSFMIAGLFMHIFSRGNIYAVTHFLLLNTALFAGIALINYIILPVISLPIGNLMQPLSPALFILVLFLIDLLWLRIRTKAAFPQ
ncbi:hypothetical protein [Paenibacillus sp.]|uniref:hypothetical protein n=1 Tax=Paenibacillus sp. TaxID=58172 RepID=UPI0028352711|nr:hypothetical protein [Paenibacillus sp.]MDR0269683.1 hypothetical protein [Paenibacillus sp.]